MNVPLDPGKGEGSQIQEQASTTQAEPANSTSKGSAVALAMYCVLLAAYALMAADRYLFPVLAPDVRGEFGFSLTQVGLLTTIFTLGLGIGGLPTGFLLSHLSRRSVLMTGTAIFSGATALTAVVPGFWTMLICLAITGIGMAMMATVMFSLAASYFYRNRAAAIGSVNVCYGLGGIFGPILAGVLVSAYGSWRVPMVVFGLAGILMVGVIALTVRPWFSETRRATDARASTGGAPTLLNRNTVILTVLSGIFGLLLYGFLGLYPTFLRESLQYTPGTAGFVMSFFGLGALASIAGGWFGDRFSPRIVLSTGFLGTAVLGYLFFNGPETVLAQGIMTCAYGVMGSAVLYVNLAAYHVKAVQRSLASRGSGMFVTSFYGASTFAGYLMGALVSRTDWVVAGEIQISLFSVVAGVIALALRPEEMST